MSLVIDCNVRREWALGATLGILLPACAVGAVIATERPLHVQLTIFAAATLSAAGNLFGLRSALREIAQAPPATAVILLRKLHRGRPFGVVFFAGMTMLAATAGTPSPLNPVLGAGIALVIAALIVASLTDWIRHTIRGDGVERQIAGAAAMASLTITLGLTMLYGLLEGLAGAPQIPMHAAALLAWVTWWAAVAAFSKRWGQ